MPALPGSRACRRDTEGRRAEPWHDRFRPPDLAAPRYRLPSKINPAPMPVPIVRNAMSRHPCPAPQRCSARAVALASFSSLVGRPNSASRTALKGAASQAGRFGGVCRMPVAESSGPPQETPTATASEGVQPYSRQASRANRASRAIPSCHESCGVEPAARASTLPSASPTTAADFVPPRSIPRNRSGTYGSTFCLVGMSRTPAPVCPS